MDFLGLRTLTLIQNCVEMIAGQTGQRLDIDHIPTDDPKTYEMFTAGKTSGLFQFESDGMRDILRRFKPDRLEHLTALNALYRPGPMQMIDDFIKRRHGQTKVSYEAPQMEPILQGTYGIMVYQEQVMQIASALAGYTLGEADILRKAMGKKKADVMATQKQKFLEGAKARNVAEKKAAKVWDHMEQFAGYGFNKSHSAAYAWLAYQTAYLKANYPPFFMAALLTSERANTDKMVQYIGECRDMGIKVLPPDLNESEMFFTVVGSDPEGRTGDIRFGLAAIKNVGEAAVEAILRARGESGAFSSLFDFCERVDLKAVNRRVIESFVKSGSLDGLDARRSSLFASIDRAMDAGQKKQRDAEQGQASLFGSFGGDDARETPRVRLVETAEWGEGERLAFEKESLGFFITGHPLERFRDELAQWATATTATLAEHAEKPEIAIGGIVAALRLIKTKKGDRMASFLLEDLEGGVEALVFPQTYKEVATRLADDQVVLVKARAEVLEEGKCRLLVADVMPLELAKLQDARFVTIRVALETWDRGRGERLRDILESHRGDCPVTLELVRGGEFAVAVQPNAYYRVRPDAAFRDEVEALLGRGALRLARTNGARADSRPREAVESH
jgi:DNA polymerase-3 subunit alpha